MCADEAISADDVAELVTRLADKSLIIIEDPDGDGHVRCRMLETLVEYGRERLAASGDAARVGAAHARYYCDLDARQRRGPAGRGAAALAPRHLLQHGQPARRVRGRDRRRGHGDGSPHRRFARLVLVVHRSRPGRFGLAHRRTEPPGVVPTTSPEPGYSPGPRSRLRLASSSGPRSTNWRSWPPPALGTTSTELCTEAISLYRQAGALDELAGIETALAVSYSTRGDHAKARDLLPDAEQILAGLDSAPWVEAMLAFVSARRAFVENRFSDAEEALSAQRSPARCCSAASVHCAFAYRYIGRLAAVRGDYDASVEAIDAALRLARGLGLSAFANVLLTDLAASLAAWATSSRLEAPSSEPLASARDQRCSAGVRESLTALAWVEWQADNYREAARLASEAIETGGSTDGGETAAHCSMILGLAAERRGDTAGARAHHRHALDVALRTGEPRLLALALEGLAAVAVQRSRRRRGRPAHRRGGHPPAVARPSDRMGIRVGRTR